MKVSITSVKVKNTKALERVALPKLSTLMEITMHRRNLQTLNTESQLHQVKEQHVSEKRSIPTSDKLERLVIMKFQMNQTWIVVAIQVKQLPNKSAVPSQPILSKVLYHANALQVFQVQVHGDHKIVTED